MWESKNVRIFAACFMYVVCCVRPVADMIH